MHYYNEIDQTAVAWLRNLIAAGLLPQGDVDDRDIRGVQPADLKGYTQHHFFAGIGGWPLALQLAGWPTTAPVWTGSCPCQPFSNAGRGGGPEDPRHLWPQFQRLIAVCKPSVVFGEQVASRAGRAWLSRVRTDLEALGYGVGAADISAASLGAPHKRQRLWWVADATGSGRMDTAAHDREHAQEGRPQWGAPPDQWEPSQGRGDEGGMGDAKRTGWEGRGPILRGEPSHRSGGESIAATSFWSDAESLPCLDNKSRRVEPGVVPLVDGFPGRVGQLRAYGNAIVPQVAAEFIKAHMKEEESETTTADNREGKMTTHTHGWRYAGTRGMAYYSRCQCGKWRHESVWATRPDIDEVLDGPPYGADSLNPRDGLGHVGIAVD